MNLSTIMGIAAAVAVVLLVVRLWFVVRSDGRHWMRATSGLPRDWSPTQEPSVPYALKHRARE